MSGQDFLPSASPQVLRQRAALLKRLRTFFDERGFLEVETPLLSADTVVELHIDPLQVTLPDDPREPTQGKETWLQTSPEFHMKRLLATGEFDAIYQVTKAFRTGERGALHNVEFTMVEWYRVGDDLAAGMALLGELCVAILGTSAAELLTYAEAFGKHAQIDPFALPEDAQRDEQLNLLLAEKVEPCLGRDRPTILYHYPASQAALAKTTTDHAGNAVAERFELYVDGVELANGYHELQDAAELRRRNTVNNAARLADGRPVLPEDSRLLSAMEQGLPQCSGVALGFDRLLMVAVGAKSIDEVIPFPIERA